MVKELIEPAEVREKVGIILKSVILTGVIIASYFAGAAVAAMFNFQNTYISGMWCAVTAVVVFDDLPENAKNLFGDRLLGTFMGALVGGITITLLGHLFFSICLSLFVVCLVISLFKWRGALKIACITTLIVNFTTFDYSVPEVWISSAMRFVEGVVGGSISMFATLLYHKGRQKGLFIGTEPEQKTS